jgi:heat shock protein HspQ
MCKREVPARPLEGARLAEGRGECKRALAIIAGDTRFSVMNMSSSSLFGIEPPSISHARFGIGEVVRHRVFAFRGVVFDIDPVFANSDEWYESIPEETRPAKDQPFYHLLAENGETSYVAYVSQQNLLPDDEEGPVDHPEVRQMFSEFRDGRYVLKRELRH